MSENIKDFQTVIVNNLWKAMRRTIMKNGVTPVKIKKDGRVTVVFWEDGTATAVKCGLEEKYDSYTAFCAALAKKVFGSNSALKRVIQNCPVAVIDPVLLDPDGCPASSQTAAAPVEMPVYGKTYTFTCTNIDVKDLD